MSKLGWAGAAIFVLSIFLVSVFAHESECQYVLETQPKTLSLSQKLTRSSSGYWDSLKALFRQAQASFFPPNLAGTWTGGDGAWEKVKEAIAKSLGNNEKTLEDSAKSAAHKAGETMQKAKDKMKKKKTQSSSHTDL